MTGHRGAALATLLRGARIVELDPWSEGEVGGGELAELAAAALTANPDLLLSVYLRYQTAGPPGELAAAPRPTSRRPARPARRASRPTGRASSRRPAPTASPSCTTTPGR